MFRFLMDQGFSETGMHRFGEVDFDYSHNIKRFANPTTNPLWYTIRKAAFDKFEFIEKLLQD